MWFSYLFFFTSSSTCTFSDKKKSLERDIEELEQELNASNATWTYSQMLQDNSAKKADQQRLAADDPYSWIFSPEAYQANLLGGQCNRLDCSLLPLTAQQHLTTITIARVLNTSLKWAMEVVKCFEVAAHDWECLGSIPAPSKTFPKRTSRSKIVVNALRKRTKMEGRGKQS